MRVCALLAFLCLTGSAFAGSPPAAIDRALRTRGATYLDSGWTADVWLSADGKSVYKRIKPIIENGQLMTKRDAAKRRAFVDHTVDSMEALRQAPEFAQYRHLLPRTRAQGRFGIVQDVASGLKLEELHGAARTRADQVMKDVKAAGQAALPGVEIDVHSGNILFEADGSPAKKGFFDPFGGWWARTWTKAKPHTRDEHAGAQFLIDRKLGSDRRAWKLEGELIPVGRYLARRASGGDLKFDEALIVANLDRKSAFVVKHGFKQVYTSTDHPSAKGRPSVAHVLGAPLDEEHLDARPDVNPGQVIQHFEKGYMTWDTERGVRVRLPATGRRRD